ncbi:MAG: hypothetical protein EKK55_17380 [Rhodocyclaceae bacterium]|nr:MAG: hypothetical protein EKK55_17380 [Rhodocyclaceae bacterium]
MAYKIPVKTTQKKPIGKPLELGADEKSPSASYWEKLGSLLDLSLDQDKRLRNFLKKNIEQWKKDTADLHDMLREDNDLVEGVVEDTGWPYEGAPNMHVPIPEIYMGIYTSVEKRSILGGDVIWYATTDDEMTPDDLIRVEAMINKKARDEWNLEEALEDVFWATNRDGLGVVQVPYVEEYEEVSDIKIYTNPAQFVAEFPNAASAGVTDQEYKKYLAAANTASEINPLEVPITYEKQVYAGPKAEVIELVDFVTFPAVVRDIDSRECRGYGKRFTRRKAIIKEYGRDGAWYREAVEKLLKKKSYSTVNDFKRSKDEIVGLQRSENADGYEFYGITVRFALDQDGKEKKYMVTYSLDCDLLLEVREYPYLIDYFATFRIERRPNQLIGKSVPSKVRDLSWEIDTQHNQRILSRQISTVPSFKGKKSAKTDFDPSAEENRWRPGVIFWLEDPEAFDQFKVQPVDLGESMSEEKNDMGLLDLYLGAAASLLSGSVAPGDPNAPGNKTQIMIGQSNLRMEEPLRELRKGVEKVGQIALSHMYQFGPVMIDFAQEADGVVTQNTVHKRLLRSAKLRMKGVTVADNPGAEMQRVFALYGQLMAEPLFQQNPQARIALLKEALQKGRVPNRDKVLPTPEAVQQQQVAIQVEAMKQMEAEKAAAAQAAAAEALKQRIAQAKQEIQVKKLAKERAGMMMGEDTSMNGARPGAV